MVLQGTFIFEFCITVGACIRSYLIMNRYFVSVETAYFEKCFVTIFTFVELFLIMNFPNVSLEPVGLRKYFPTMTAFICRALCFCIHLRVCSRWWRHTLFFGQQFSESGWLSLRCSRGEVLVVPPAPSVCSGLTSLNVSVCLSVLLVSTVQVVTVTSSLALILWLWLWTGISLCPIGLVTLNPANDKS